MTALAPFAAVEALVNQGITQHLSNATATYQGGAPFGVLFDRRGQELYDDALAAAAFQASYCLANTPGLVEGGALVVGGVSYTVVGPVQPDAGGWVTVALSPA